MAITLGQFAFVDAQQLTDAVAMSYGPLIGAQAEELTEILNDLSAQVQQISTSPDLTPVGKIGRLKEAANKALDRIERTKRKRGKLDQDLERAKADLPTTLPRPAGDNATLELRLQEIRRILVDMRNLERDAAAIAAGDRADRLVLLAIQDDPAKGLRPLVNEDTFHEAKARYLAASEPETYARLHTIESALRSFEANARRAERLVGQAAGVPTRADHPNAGELEEQAGGQ